MQSVQSLLGAVWVATDQNFSYRQQRLIRLHYKNIDAQAKNLNVSFKAHGMQHDKTNKMEYVRSKDSDQPGHLPSLISLCCAHTG